eukprot:740657-Rhodomonas_salina.1
MEGCLVDTGDEGGTHRLICASSSPHTLAKFSQTPPPAKSGSLLGPRQARTTSEGVRLPLCSTARSQLLPTAPAKVPRPAARARGLARPDPRP